MCGFMRVCRCVFLAFFCFSCLLFLAFYLVLFIFSSVSLCFIFICLFGWFLTCLFSKERKKEGMKLNRWGGRRDLEEDKKRKTII